MTAAGQAQQRAEQQQLAPAAVQAAPPPLPLPNPGGGNPKGKGPLSNPEQNVIQQGAAAAATIVKAVITTVDPAVQACVDTATAADCLLAGLGGLGFFASDGASALDDPALAEGLGADTADTGLTAGEAGTAAGCLPSAVPGGMSFTAATPVLLPGGKTAPIATLKPGDKVQATNTTTGKTSPETVAAVEVHHDTNLYNLNVKTPHGVQVIHTTANHLFWDPHLKQWIAAAKLKKGEHLKTADGAVATADGGTTPVNHDGLDVGPHHPRQRRPRLLRSPRPTITPSAFTIPTQMKPQYSFTTTTSIVQMAPDRQYCSVSDGSALSSLKQGAFKGRSIYAVAQDLVKSEPFDPLTESSFMPSGTKASWFLRIRAV